MSEQNWIRQVDEISGGPVYLYTDWIGCKAWLRLEFYDRQYSKPEMAQYEKLIESWGVRECRSSKEHERLFDDVWKKVLAAQDTLKRSQIQDDGETHAEGGIRL